MPFLSIQLDTRYCGDLFLIYKAFSSGYYELLMEKRKQIHEIIRLGVLWLTYALRASQPVHPSK
jgi:hypothetical protein